MPNIMRMTPRAVFRRSTSARISVVAASLASMLACGGGGGDGGSGVIGPLPVATVEVTAPKTSLELGETVQFTATPRDRNGTAVASSAITWSASPQSIATVDSKGLVTASAAGIATVTAIAGGISGNKGVTVSDTGIPFASLVSMPGNSFSPFNVTIRVTGNVSWEFASDAHDVVFVEKAGTPANIPVTTRATVKRTFLTIGVFPYDCRVHPGMSGQVTVVQ